MIKICKQCWLEFLDKTNSDYCYRPNCKKSRKEFKPIKQISDKKKERIKNDKSERNLFVKIAIDRSKDWYVVAKHLDRKDGKIIQSYKMIHIFELKPINFSHIKPKWMNEDLRLDENNIEIVSHRFHLYEHTGQYLVEDFNN